MQYTYTITDVTQSKGAFNVDTQNSEKVLMVETGYSVERRRENGL